MPVKPIVRLMPHAVTRPGHRPRRLSLAAGLAAVAALVACLAAGSASAAPARPARPATAGSAGTAAAMKGWKAAMPDVRGTVTDAVEESQRVVLEVMWEGPLVVVLRSQALPDTR